MASTSQTPRLLRLTIKLYKSQGRQGGEGHDFRPRCYSPPAYRSFVDDMNCRNNRGWLIDDHDVTIEFYFRSFAELNRVNSDPEFQALQASEEPFVNRIRTVASLSWVEKYVDEGKVVNIVDDKSTYPSYDKLLDLSSALGTSGAWVKKDEADVAFC
ncbi:hypothetical protein CNMCM6805_003333 [Aspergillus fumigatiaffinis]|uniref:EthD domain-containing protein n=1 Tax=Aspergillus fumigatiaffinis TaxID=340414 RepID=A0A8H4GS40_9EURO|nr:hypothetical protein CNMCM5878_007736 [Aspergillus fumigatiaffinis]KAF4227208.1 hypothetical protein CNMCM6805_003333 [Aspergillus fumigatiaffinis]